MNIAESINGPSFVSALVWDEDDSASESNASNKTIAPSEDPIYQ